MSDIFISYSRKDSEQALQLAELLRSAGLSCWIDTQGIDLATSWSGEIVDAIYNCKAFIVLLSPSSAASPNVAKEIALASERQKKILPLDLEPIELPREFAYQLAGIQRSQMTNIDGIIRSLERLGLKATSAPSITLIHPVDLKKSLMILPFEDLSPTQDNAWFTDGMASELTLALSNVKTLRVIDWNTSRMFRDRRVRTTDLAKELQVRYFIEGQVRKFGDQIKVALTLLDIETGDHLWQDSMKGTMDDVFDIQETVAKRVLDGLKIHLDADEKKKLIARGTDNAEAYELFLKAHDYASLHTRESTELAIQQFTLAIELDLNYALALKSKAYCLTDLYRGYDRDPALIAEAERLVKRALELEPNQWQSYEALSAVCRLQGKLPEAEEAALEYRRRAPNEFSSHFALAFYYSETNQPALAIEPYERAVELKPTSLPNYLNIVIALDRCSDQAKAREWAIRAIPHFERRLRLVPDDETARIQFATVLYHAGEAERLIELLTPLRDKQKLDGVSHYNIACLYAKLGRSELAIEGLQKAIDAGFTGSEAFHYDPDLDLIRDHDEFKRLLDKIEEKHTNV